MVSWAWLAGRRNRDPASVRQAQVEDFERNNFAFMFDDWLPFSLFTLNRMSPCYGCMELVEQSGDKQALAEMEVQSSKFKVQKKSQGQSSNEPAPADGAKIKPWSLELSLNFELCALSFPWIPWRTKKAGGVPALLVWESDRFRTSTTRPPGHGSCRYSDR